MKHLPLLMRIAQTVKLRHLKVATFLAVFLVVSSSAGLGGYEWGWKGAVFLPLGLLAVLAVTLHLFLVLVLALGLRAHRKGNFNTAAGCLWLSELPPLRRYDRHGKAAAAFRECRARVAAQMMQNVAKNFLKTL